MRRATSVLLVAVSLGIVGGCGGVKTTLPGDTAATAGSREPGLVAAVGWPEAIPDVIPPLPGQITSVIASDSHVRLFCEGLTEATVRDYLDQLTSGGFALEYIVYETAVDPDRARERAAAGEWDAVQAIRGDLSLRLEFGGGTGTLDITGIPLDEFDPPTSWPAEWAGIPAPTSLVIDQVISLGGTGPIVEARYENDADIARYEEELVAAGFTVADRSFNQDHQIISIRVTDFDRDVVLWTYPGGRLRITVTPATSTSPPEFVATTEFPTWLPPVPGGELITATEGPGGGFAAVVVIGQGHTVTEYVRVLEAAGYAESDTMLAGYILTDGERTVTIFGDDTLPPPRQISIAVTVP